MFENKIKAYKQTIASRLVIYVVLFSTAIMLFVTALQLYFDYKSDIAVIESRLQQIENVSLRTLSHGLWIADKKNMRFHLEGLVELPDMQYFEIKDRHVKWIGVGEQSDRNIIQREYPLNYQYKGKQYDIGSLIVVASLNGVYDRLIDRAWLVLISNGIKTFIVSIFILSMFYHLVTRHIYKITKFVESLNFDNLAPPLTLQYSKDKDYNRDDEINTLTRGVNKMRLAIHTNAEKLKEREKYISLTLDCVRDGVIATDQSGIITRMNPSAKNITGYSSIKSIGLHISTTFFLKNATSQKELLLTDNIPDYLNQISAAGLNTLLITRDKRERWVSVSASTITDNLDTSLGLILTFRDVTDEYNAQKLIQESQQKLTFHYENTPLGVIEWDNEFKVSEWNASAEKIFGINRSDALGMTLDDLSPASTDPQQISAQTFWNNLTDNNPNCNRTMLNQSAQGDVRWCEWYNTTLTDVNGKRYGFASLVADITQRKMAETELEEHRLHLEALVKERTKELEVSNKELESFCSAVSHDLRAPLRGINGFSQMLVEDVGDTLDEQNQDYLQRICKSAVKMEQLISDLLALSKISRANLSKKEINLSAMVDSVLQSLQEREPHRKVTIDIQNNITAWGDQRFINILLDNLLGNAWKYTNQKTDAHIEFGSTTINSEDTFFVKDNGAGFNEEYSSKLFSPFQRLHGISEFEGTGIGLATAQRVVEKHGGRIWGRSTVGQGATFYFTLK